LQFKKNQVLNHKALKVAWSLMTEQLKYELLFNYYGTEIFISVFINMKHKKYYIASFTEIPQA